MKRPVDVLRPAWICFLFSPLRSSQKLSSRWTMRLWCFRERPRSTVTHTEICCSALWMMFRWVPSISNSWAELLCSNLDKWQKILGEFQESHFGIPLKNTVPLLLTRRLFLIWVTLESEPNSLSVLWVFGVNINSSLAETGSSWTIFYFWPEWLTKHKKVLRVYIGKNLAIGYWGN